MAYKFIIINLALGYYFFQANLGETTTLLHKGKEITVSLNAVQSHLDHGDVIDEKQLELLNLDFYEQGNNGE